MPSSIEITRHAARRESLTIADLREFLAECERVGLPADLPLRADTSYRGWMRSIVATSTSPKTAASGTGKKPPSAGQKPSGAGQKSTGPGQKPSNPGQKPSNPGQKPA